MEEIREREEIRNNLDLFKSDFDVIKEVYRVPKYIQMYCICGGSFPAINRYMDHTRIFKTKNREWIVTWSPYVLTSDDPNVDRWNILLDINDVRHKNLIDDGWQKTYQLYSTIATTYMKIIPMKTKK